MSSIDVTATKTRQNYGWVLVFGVALIQIVSAGFLLAFSGPGTFESDTGVSWIDLTNTFPTVADQFAVSQRASLTATLALGLVSLSVAYFGLKDGQRWAWYTLWILPASMIPGMVSLAQSENQAGVAIFAAGLILIAAVGLVLSYRGINLDS